MNDSSSDSVGAFVPGPRTRIAGAAGGPLHGLTFGLKDLYDIEGEFTGGGNPVFRRTHPPAAAHAMCLQLLLAAGATLVGRTITVELAYGLTGENVHDGTPKNPAAPDRFPGGSSAGSAAAVAAGLCDIAIGSDTGGSVRIPASYCGLFGIRPSWGAVNAVGCLPLAPSFDTVGWFARDGATLARVGRVLLPEQEEFSPGPLLVVEDAWENADTATAAALANTLGRLEAEFGPAMRLRLMPQGIGALYEAFLAGSAPEAWVSHGPWITATSPKFGPGIAGRFEMARRIAPERAAAARALRAQFTRRLRPLLAGGAVLVYPTSPGPAPLIDSDRAEQQRVRERLLAVTAISGLAGLPEVSIPGGVVDGAPVGISIVADRARDRMLLAMAARMT
jgi:amidase